MKKDSITWTGTYAEILPNNKEGEILTWEPSFEAEDKKVVKKFVPLKELFFRNSIKDIWGEGSDWRGDIQYTLTEEEESKHWLKKDLQKELDFFLKEEIQEFGGWDCWSEDEHFGDIYEGYFDIEKKLEEKLNLEKITPRLFYDAEKKIGYYIGEYASFASPEYNIWFFEK